MADDKKSKETKATEQPKPAPKKEIATKEEIKSAKDQKNKIQAEIKDTERLLELYKQINDEKERSTLIAEANSDLNRQQIEFLDADRSHQLKTGEWDKEKQKNYEKEKKQRTEQKKSDDEKLKNQERSNNLTKQTSKDIQETLLSSTGLSRVYGNISDALKSGAGGAGVFKAIMIEAAMAAAEMFIKIADANSEFAKSTGQVADFSASFGYGLSNYGVGVVELTRASSELFKEMSAFSNLNKETQEQLTVSAAKMEKLGVSAGITGKNYDILTKSLRMSAGEAIKTNEALAKAAIGAGIAPSKMIGEFSQNMGKMAAYGKQGVDVFVSLEKQAKSLGMQVQQLTAIIGDQFDTFEGSARAAGKLNAVLGGNYLNSVEMLNATESERIVLLKKSFDESGKNFDSLSKYEKKAVAATLGIKDLDEASRLFGNSTSDLTMDMEKQAVEQERLENIQREATKVTERLSMIFNQLMIVVRPIVEIFVFFSTTIANFNDQMGGFGGLIWLVVGAFVFWEKTVAMTSGSLAFLKTITTANMFSLTGLKNLLNTPAGRFGLVTMIFMIASALMMLHDALLVPHSPILYFALLMLPFIIMAIGEAADASEEGLKALGAAILMIGIGVGAAAFGLSMLVKSFQGLTGGEMAAALTAIVLVLGAFAAGVWFLVTTTSAAVVPLIALGVAFLLLGAGVALAGLGLSMVVDAIAKMVDPAILAGTANLALSILALIFPLTLLGLVSPFIFLAGVGFLALGVGLAMTAAALQIIPDSIDKLADPKFAIGILAFSGALAVILPLLYLLSLTGPGLLFVGGAFMMLAVAATIVSFSLKMISGSLGEIADGFTKLAEGPTITGALKLGAALLALILPLAWFTVAIPSLLAVGAAFLMLGLGMKLLSESFRPDLPDVISQVAGGLIEMIPGILALSLMSPFLFIAGISILILADAFAILAGVIGGLSEHLERTANAFSILVDPAVIDGIATLRDSIFSLIGGVFTFGLIAAPLLRIGLSTYLVGVGAKMLGEGLKLISENLGKLKGSGAVISDLASGISDLMLSMLVIGAVGMLGGGLGFLVIAAGISIMVLAIQALAAALESIPENKAVTLTALNETLTTVKAISEEDIQPTKKFVVAVKDYYEAQSKAKDADKDSLVAALKQVMASTQGQKADQKIKLIITGNELAKALKVGDTLVDAKITMGVS